MLTFVGPSLHLWRQARVVTAGEDQTAIYFVKKGQLDIYSSIAGSNCQSQLVNCTQIIRLGGAWQVTWSGELTEYSGGSVGGPQSCLTCCTFRRCWMVAYTENWGKEYWWVCGWFWSSPSWSKWLGLNIVRSCCVVEKIGAHVPGKILYIPSVKKERAWEAHQKRINYQLNHPNRFFQLQ